MMVCCADCVVAVGGGQAPRTPRDLNGGAAIARHWARPMGGTQRAQRRIFKKKKGLVRD